MSTNVKAVPDGYHTLTAYLIVDDALRALAFYQAAFGAVELFRIDHEGRIGHAEMKIGDTPFMLADEFPAVQARSPKSLGGSPVSFLIYVEDVDAAMARALAAGAALQKAVELKFYGDRMGSVTDPFGYTWSLATHVEDVSPEEMERRAASQH